MLSRLFIAACCHLIGKGWPLGSRLYCWYPGPSVVSIPDLCHLFYFNYMAVFRCWSWQQTEDLFYKKGCIIQDYPTLFPLHKLPAGKGLTSWLSFVVSSCEFVTFPLVSWVRCGTWLYRFLIFATLLTLIIRVVLSVLRGRPEKYLRTFS